MCAKTLMILQITILTSPVHIHHLPIFPYMPIHIHVYILTYVYEGLGERAPRLYCLGRLLKTKMVGQQKHCFLFSTKINKRSSFLSTENELFCPQKPNLLIGSLVPTKIQNHDFCGIVLVRHKSRPKHVKNDSHTFCWEQMSKIRREGALENNMPAKYAKLLAHICVYTFARIFVYVYTYAYLLYTWYLGRLLAWLLKFLHTPTLL